jgi:hypothetical protein
MIEMDFVDDAQTLDEKIKTLQLLVSTVDAHDARTKDFLDVNVVFSDDTRLYEPVNFRIFEKVGHQLLNNLPKRGHEVLLPLDVPPLLDRSLGDISEVYIRKGGSDGWLVGKVVLFANGKPLIGNSSANQFLDNDESVFTLTDWSTASFCVAQTSDQRFPLLPSGYRLLGAVIGPISDKTGSVLYRVDREGNYRFRVTDSTSGTTVYNVPIFIGPTARFLINGLHNNRRYDFDLKFVRAGVESVVPGAAGSFTTYPPEGARTKFTFAFGSCANAGEQATQGSWTSIRSLANTPLPNMSAVRLFVHLGDSFYFYDDMTEEAPHNIESMHAAHVSSRRNIEFLNMAKEIPCCGVWDDHDFAGNNTESNDLIIDGKDLRNSAVDVWRQYWGNQPLEADRDDLGLTTRISYGVVDVYLLDGRYYRDYDHGVCFTQEMIHRLADMLDQRSQEGAVARTVVLATGSNWTHEWRNKTEDYGYDKYTDEREDLYKVLTSRMGTRINGVILLSGDNHINEIFHVKLGNNRRAPEFSVSPYTLQDDVEDTGRKIEGERVWSHASGGSDGKRGFATLTIDPFGEGRDNWKATVRFFQEAFAGSYQEVTYVTSNGEYVFSSANPPLP